MSLPDVFQSQADYRGAFERGLTDMLSGHHDLGVFILVLANSIMDPELRERLTAGLEARFKALTTEPPEATGDDSVVFEKLRGIGWRAIGPVRRRAVGDFELQLNRLRGLRPARNAAARMDSVRKPFDPQGFHFAKPFLRKETFWAGGLLGTQASLLYNKFPFLPLHGLLVPELGQGHPQFLAERWHRYVWELVQLIGATLPGVGIGYNAYGGSASVNHLHFQLFARPDPLPVDAAYWAHNGGDRDYPSGCLRHDDADSAWRQLDGLNRADRPYNLIYRPGHMYCLPRCFQGAHERAEWNEGYAFYEMAGGLTVFDQARYEALTVADMSGELSRMRAVRK